MFLSSQKCNILFQITLFYYLIKVVCPHKHLYKKKNETFTGVKNPVKVAHKLAEEQNLGPLPLGRVRPR